MAARFDIEPFAVFAGDIVRRPPLVVPGVCAFPSCSRRFAQTRDWQIYCCRACANADMAEMRNVGLKVAPSLLAHRAGKYETRDGPLREVSRLGRRHWSRAIGDWFADRQRRAGEAAR